MTLAAERVPTAGLRESLPGLLSLALASCLAVTTEMLPVGLLPEIGAAFAVPDSVTGLLVGLYAVMVATLAVPLTVATSRFARKPLLLTTVAGYALSNALVAAAPTFAVVAVGRTVGGVTHALFFSLVIGYAPRLVSQATCRPRARARRPAAPRSGFVLGVPLSDVAGQRRRVAGVLRGSGCAVDADVRARRQVAAAGRPRTVDAQLARARPQCTRRSRGIESCWCFSVSSPSTRSSAVLLLASGVSPAFVGPILLGVRRLRASRPVVRRPQPRPKAEANGGGRAGGGHGRRRRTRLTWPTLAAVLIADRRVEWRIRRCAVDLPDVRGAHACDVTRTSPVRGSMPPPTSASRAARLSAPGCSTTAGLWSLPWAGASLMGLGLAVRPAVSQGISGDSPDDQPAALGLSGGQLPCASAASSKCQISLA